MDLPRVSRAVRRVTILSRDESGSVVPVVVFSRRRKKKKSSRPLRPLEEFTRQWAEAGSRTGNNYLARHKKSNRKRRDGWLIDVNGNLLRAGQKGLRKIDPTRLFNL